MEAIIEIGTNSLKLFVYQTDHNLEVVLDRTIITRLGEGYNQTGEISLSALTRTLAVIHTCIKTIEGYRCRTISLYGTMIFRSAKNSEEVLSIIFQETGLKLDVISGEKEAEYSFLAAMQSFSLNNKNVLVIDTGGGSTEFIFGLNGIIEKALSLNIGAVTATDRFLLSNKVDALSLERCEKYLKEKISGVDNTIKPDIIIGIGGTVTTISAIVQKLELYSAEKVHGSKVLLNDIYELETELAEKNLEERKDIIGLSPKRADIILGGVLIIKSILENFKVSEMLVCDHGLRYGLALKEWRKK